MIRHPPRFLYVCLLAALLLRVALGAPCCLPGSSAHGNGPAAEQPAHHQMAMAHGAEHGPECGPEAVPTAHHPADHTGHDGADHAAHPDNSGDHDHHSGDNAANPCCSACGPTLASSPPQIAIGTMLPAAPIAQRFETRAARDLIHHYHARGPPLIV